jgi:hypothetical protein
MLNLASYFQDIYGIFIQAQRLREAFKVTCESGHTKLINSETKYNITLNNSFTPDLDL